jgi:hypothetical protein
MATIPVGKTTQNREGWIIPVREKISYFVGAGSNFTVHTFVTSFLAAYLLMIGVSPRPRQPCCSS